MTRGTGGRFILDCSWAGSIVFRFVAGEGKSCSPLRRHGSNGGEGIVQGRKGGWREGAWRETNGEEGRDKMPLKDTSSDLPPPTDPFPMSPATPSNSIT